MLPFCRMGFVFFAFLAAAPLSVHAADSPSALEILSTAQGEPVQAFYAARQYRPAWTDMDGLTPQGQRLLDVLKNAAVEGLRPQDYHTDQITDLLQKTLERSQVDLLLSQGLVLYTQHLRMGRVSPARVGAHFDQGPTRPDPLTVLNQAVETDDLAGFVAQYTPPHGAYRRLRALLAMWRKVADATASTPWVALPEGPSLRPDAVDARVPLLKKRLKDEGLLAAGVSDDKTYSAPVVAAVKKFQASIGLVDDGIVGTTTRQALNASPQDRVNQIIATMERLRWLPDDLGARYVFVNIPSYHLYVLEKDAIVLDMSVIVGSTERPTPLMGSSLRAVVFNPTWTVPVKIATKDILPKLQRDPSYLSNHGIRLYDGWSNESTILDPSKINWHGVGNMGRYRLQQAPGSINALGRYKFLFPNNDSIYLHDTAEPQKFSKVLRALSSGCVRVSQPDVLADYLLSTRAGWSVDKRKAAIDSAQTRHIPLAEPVPVYLFYMTVWLDADGNPQFRNDLYGLDAALIKAIEAKKF